jgi:phospholipid/cholesterol/gamma-HCH transport system ATP-binding protein
MIPTAPSKNVVINIENLHTEISGKTVHTGVDLKIYEGETMVIIGGSGVGKSVLLKHMIGLMSPLSGIIEVLGKNINKINPKALQALREDMGVLFQGGALFDSLTIEENVGFLLTRRKKIAKEQARAIVREKLEMLGIRGIQDKLPGELSVGMAKRVGLARAIATNPRIIFYDEPTTGIDPIMADIINELILKLQKELNVTSVVVTHDMKSAYKIGNRIAMLYNGQIIFVGTPDEIRTTENPHVREFIYGMDELIK